MTWRVLAGGLEMRVGAVESRAEVYDAAAEQLWVEVGGSGTVATFHFRSRRRAGARGDGGGDAVGAGGAVGGGAARCLAERRSMPPYRLVPGWGKPNFVFVTAASDRLRTVAILKPHSVQSYERVHRRAELRPVCR